MQPAATITVPLTAEEKDLLLTIYKKRGRLLLTVYAILIVLAFAVSWIRIDVAHNPRAHQPVRRISRVQMWLISFTLLETMVVGTGAYFLSKRVLPFKKDADSGIKEQLSYTVVRKEYFSLTNKYYVSFDDPNYLHHEVDEATYNNCSEGDYMYIYRAIQSKFVFEEDGRFTLM